MSRAATRAVSPRMRVISDNDYAGDPDGLVQLAHLLLSPSVVVSAVIGSHLRPGDPFDSSATTAANAVVAAGRIVELVGPSASGVPVLAGSEVALADAATPRESAAARAIIAEAMREDTPLPLHVTCGAGLTDLASAYLMEPAIAQRLTVVWIGGREHEGLAVPPPGAAALEYNLAIDVIAAQVVFDSPIRLWQVPRDAYRQCLVSAAELEARMRPQGALGAHLHDAVTGVVSMAARHGVMLGETYVMGDSPLVLLTALQSSFEADPSSSEYAVLPVPRITDEGGYAVRTGGRTRARTMRVYTRLDVRLLFEDLFAKLAGAAAEG